MRGVVDDGRSGTVQIAAEAAGVVVSWLGRGRLAGEQVYAPSPSPYRSLYSLYSVQSSLYSSPTPTELSIIRTEPASALVFVRLKFKSKSIGPPQSCFGSTLLISSEAFK